MYRLALLMFCGCSFGMRGGVASTTSGKAQATGTLGIGAGSWGRAALFVTPEVAVTAGSHGPGVAGGAGLDLMLQEASSDLGFYVGPRILAEYDGGGATHEAIEAGLLLRTISHRIDEHADAQSFFAPSWDARSIRRTQLGLTVRYDRVRRFDDTEPVDDRVLVGLTLSWSDVHGYSDPHPSERSAPAAAPTQLATKTITTTITADPQQVLEALIGLADQPGGYLILRSRTDAELTLVRHLGQREDTGAAVDIEVVCEIALAPVAGGTQLTAHLHARAPEADEAVRLTALALPTFITNMLLARPPWPPLPRVTMLEDGRGHLPTARWDACAVYPTHPDNPAFSADAPTILPAGTPWTLHFRGVAVGPVKGEPAWAVYDASVNYELARPMCGSRAPVATMVESKIRLDGTPAYPRLAADAFAAADALAKHREGMTEADHRAQALVALRVMNEPSTPQIEQQRTETGAWHDGQARFTFQRTVAAENDFTMQFASVVETIVIDVDLRDPAAPPVIVSDEISHFEGAIPDK